MTAVVVQRVRVRWSKEARGARDAAHRDLFLDRFLGRERYDAEFDGRVSLYGLSR